MSNNDPLNFHRIIVNSDNLEEVKSEIWIEAIITSGDFDVQQVIHSITQWAKQNKVMINARVRNYKDQIEIDRRMSDNIASMIFKA